AEVRGERSAEIGGKKDRAEDRRARDEIKDETDQLDDAKGSNHADGVTDLFRPLDDERRMKQMQRDVEQQEENRERAQHSSGPHLKSRHFRFLLEFVFEAIDRG